MTASELRADTWNVLRVLGQPARGLATLAARPRAGAALLCATALALGAAAAIAPRTDYGFGSEPPPSSDAASAPEPTPYERTQAAETARKLGQVTDVAEAALMPTVLAGLAACALALAFRAAGARVAVSAAFGVTAHGMLPVWIARVLAIPAAVAHGPVPRADVPRLLPSSAAALLGPGASSALSGALSGLDLFALWAAALVALGMAGVAGTSRARALVVTLLLYACWIALARVALPSLVLPPVAP